MKYNDIWFLFKKASFKCVLPEKIVNLCFQTAPFISPSTLEEEIFFLFSLHYGSSIEMKIWPSQL